ncbi:hypothetical protein ExPECSC029_00762 [Escherichia coli]|nr:hypothetical protein ExPECSC029_00762 [Escherichia coli]
MPPTPAMQALIEQIYHIFRRYPAPKQFVVCCEYCLSQQEQKALRNTSLRAIPYSLINAWNSSPGPDPQNSDEVRYFLPRLLEFVAQGQFDNIHEVFSLRRINLASKENWREDEREILQQFACQYMTDWVSGDEAVELQYKLEMFFRLYIPPVILGFVIVPLLVWPTVIALAVLIFTLTFLAEIIFSFPLLVVRISLQELQLELLVEYALFFSVMGGIGWQFSRRTPPELKNRLHCWLVFSPVYFWLILSNFILYISPEKSALLENIRNFFLTFVWLPLNFSPFWPQPWTDFVGPISAQLGFALGYYCQWRSKNRSHRKKWGDWVTCLSLAILALGPLFNYLQ